MNCREIEFTLLGDLDGRLSEIEHKGLEGHLAGCAACRARAQQLRLLWGALDQLSAVEPSALFDARLRARLAAEPPPSSWGEGIRARLKAAATWPRLTATVAALVVLTVWLAVRPPWGRNQPGTPQAPSTQVEGQASAESETDFPVVKDLPVFENYDVISNFDALSALPSGQSPKQPVE